ncbi:MAG: hemolysin family protein [Zoogloea sp.]|uniref:hemolysin family protein n=1 Tax=Zoogloea sp. TaxID=49181 RepID=UPI003F2A6769
MEQNVLLILLALLLVALNGFFVAAEFGLVKLRPTRVKAIAKRYGLRGRLLAKVHGQLDAYLSACQLGITLASLGLGWIGEPAFAELVTPVLAWLGVHSPELVHGIAFFVAFFTISFLHIVVGELAPKSLAIRVPESMAVWTAPPLYAFYWAMYPAIWLLNTSANGVLRLAGLNGDHGHESAYSTEELKLILRSSRAPDQFTADEWKVLAYALDFSHLEVAELMRPIKELVSLSQGRSLAENLATIASQRYSRYPYLDESGKALGLVHIKNLFLAQQAEGPLRELETLLTPISQVAPDTPAFKLFREFRLGAPHLALVGFAGQAPIGFVTLDNLLAALVGEIRDEFRQSRNDWLVLEEGDLLGKGSLPLFTLERALGVQLDSENAGSIGGLIMEKLGDVPKEGDCVAFEHFDAVVKRMNGPRILLVRVQPKRLNREAPAAPGEG